MVCLCDRLFDVLRLDYVVKAQSVFVLCLLVGGVCVWELLALLQVEDSI